MARTPIFAIHAEDWWVRRARRFATYYLLEASDWVNVVAVDGAQRVVMIRQHRVGSRRVELEIPGGAMDRRDAGPLAAAKRELLEETGCTARRWVSLGWVQPNPAFHRNRSHQFLAVGVGRAGAQRLDFAEDIAVTRVPLARIPGLIARGRIRHALVLTALHAALTLPAARRALR